MKNKKEYFWGLMGRFLPQGIFLLTTMILARFVTPEDFGKIGVLSIIFVVANILLDAGLGGSLVKEEKLTKLDCSTIGVFNMCVSFSIYIILFVSSDFLEKILRVNDISNIIKILSLVFPITALGIVPKAIMNRNLQFKESCISSSSACIIASIVAIIMALNNGGVYSLVAYQIVSSIVVVSLSFLFSKYSISFRFSVSSLKRILPFGLFTSVISIIDTIYENLITTMTGMFLNVKQAGYMYQAKRVEETASSSIATTVSTVAFPLLTKYKNDLRQFSTEAESTFKYITCISIPVLVTIAIFSKQILLLLFGKQWIEASLYLEILVFSGCFIVQETLIRNFIKALCKVKSLLFVTITKRVIGISLILIFLYYDASYIVYGYVLSSFVGFVLNSALYLKLVKYNASKFLLDELRIFIPSLIYFLFFKLFLMEIANIYINIVLSIITIVAVYFTYMKMLGFDIFSKLRELKRK